MPLAGRMRLNTFLAMIAAGGAVGGAGWVILGPEPEPEPDPPPLAQTATPTQTPATQPAAAAPSAETPTLSVNSHEFAVLRFAGKDLGTSKKKDAASGQSYKVNLYQDDGHSTMNRAKVDLDRDDKWDEKWTFEGDTVTRQISPDDDEDYSIEQFWDGSSWSNGAASAAAAETEAAPAASGSTRPVDDFILSRVGNDLGTKKIKDATKGRAYKVNLYQDDGSSTVNRAKVDLDRDDKWDEKWTIDGSTITRKVSPDDDERYTVEQTWSGSSWQ